MRMPPQGAQGGHGERGVKQRSLSNRSNTCCHKGAKMDPIFACLAVDLRHGPLSTGDNAINVRGTAGEISRSGGAEASADRPIPTNAVINCRPAFAFVGTTPSSINAALKTSTDQMIVAPRESMPRLGQRVCALECRLQEFKRGALVGLIHNAEQEGSLR